MHWNEFACTVLIALGAANGPSAPPADAPRLAQATPGADAPRDGAPSRPEKPRPSARPKAGPTSARPASADPDEARPEADASPEAAALTEKVQAFYDALEDYQAEFVQTYYRRALDRESESSGTLTIKKGGKVRWSYVRPAKKLFVADGETLWIYEPEEMQVIVDRRFSTEKLGGSIAFLWGEGSLAGAFDIQAANPEAHGFPEDAAALELVPKRDRTYAKLVIRVDPKTGRVVESVVHETSGNTNRFLFMNPEVNQGVPDAKFEFVPPAGVDVVEARPS